MIYSYPKIFHLGDKNTKNIFCGNVEVTEKVDGSQFNFGKIGPDLHCRSRGKDLVLDAPEKMFIKAVDYVKAMYESLPLDLVFHCEYLNKEKHNTLTYGRVPKNNLVCFGVSKPDGIFYQNHGQIANEIGIDQVPVLYEGEVTDVEKIKALLETESYLGGTKVEGIVIKNYHQQILIGDQCIPILTAKFVSEMFKEKHTGWRKEHTSKGKLEDYMESFRHEGRWNKAVQHLTEEGTLTMTPKDIGPLMKEIHSDLDREEKEAIKEQLWVFFGKDIKRKATAGFPEYYKNKLMEGCFK